MSVMASHSRPWTPEDLKDLEIGYIHGLELPAIAHHLARDVSEVLEKARQIGLIESRPLAPDR